MTSEEMKEMNVKRVAEIFLTNKCGKCGDCEFSDTVVLIGDDPITLCHLIYSILKEDRKQYILVQQEKANGILGRV